MFCERDVPYYAAQRDLTTLPGSGTLRLYDGWEAVRGCAERELSDADAGMVTSYCPDALLASAALLDSPAALRVWYDLDAPVTLDLLERRESVRAWARVGCTTSTWR